VQFVCQFSDFHKFDYILFMVFILWLIADIDVKQYSIEQIVHAGRF